MPRDSRVTVVTPLAVNGISRARYVENPRKCHHCHPRHGASRSYGQKTQKSAISRLSGPRGARNSHMGRSRVRAARARDTPYKGKRGPTWPRRSRSRRIRPKSPRLWRPPTGRGRLWRGAAAVFPTQLARVHLARYRRSRRRSGGHHEAPTHGLANLARWPRGAPAPSGAERGPWRCHPLWKRAAARLQGYARGGRRPVARYSDGTLGIKAGQRGIRTPNYDHT
jgi:hypothetical protein